MSTTATAAFDLRRPRLRSDLEIIPQESPEGVVYLVQDARAGRFCRFREMEYFIATQCNGERSTDEICRCVADKLKRELPLETIERFLHTLGGLGLLQSPGDDVLNPKIGRCRGKLAAPTLTTV